LRRRVVVRREAHAELSEAAARYRSKSPTVAARFRTDVREAIVRISDWPAAFTEISPGIRRALTSQFPYAIFYAEETGGIVILAIKHQA
jgi:plasmid stabilization system protein ParE